jgi:UDP-glucose 4-epimerase
MAKRYLITGGSGFIGANLVRRLLAIDCDVHILIRAESSLWRLDDVKSQVHFWTGDLTDSDSLIEAVTRSQPEVVIHLGGGSMGQPWNTDFSQLSASLEVNLHGTLNLIQAVSQAGIGLRSFIRMGGLLEYGDGPFPFVESQREQPVSIYPATQVATTAILNAVHKGCDFPIISLRLASVYGPGRSLEFFIPSLICAALNGRDFAMTSGEQRWDMLYINDAVDAILTAANSDCPSGEVINIGSGETYSLKQIAQTVVDQIDTAGQLQIAAKPDPEGAIGNLICSVDKADRLLGWKSETSLEDGLRKTIKWYRDNLQLLQQHAE